MLVHLYKADALLCLERVQECYEFLTDVVDLKLKSCLSLKGLSEPARAELTRCHEQLLNNIAVVTACQDSVMPAITILRNALLTYPESLSIKFNLTLLLWRQPQREAACAVWIEARGWDLKMEVKDIPDEKDMERSLVMTAACEQAMDGLNESKSAVIDEHVSDPGTKSGVSEQQLVFLDSLVLNHWRKVRNSKAVESSIFYAQYLEAHSANSL